MVIIALKNYLYLPGNTWYRLEVRDQIDLLDAHVAEKDCLPTTLEQQKLIKGLEDVQRGLWGREGRGDEKGETIVPSRLVEL